jgi:uncharacterized protein YkwD
MTAQVIGKIHRRILPFTLSIRLLTLTTAPSMAAIVQVNTAHALDNQVTVVAERFAVSELLAATNAAREKMGVAPLILSSLLNEAAARKVEDMRTQGYWDHYRPTDKKAPWDFMKEAGYNYRVAGENLARGFKTVNGITEAWLASPTHRANLLSAKYTEVGFADAETIDENGDKILLTVQMLGDR